MKSKHAIISNIHPFLANSTIYLTTECQKLLPHIDYRVSSGLNVKMLNLAKDLKAHHRKRN